MRSARSVVLLATLLALCSFSVAAVAGLAATERELVKRVQAQEQSSIALLEQIVNVNSGTMNFAGVRQVADILRPHFAALGFKVRWEDGAAFNNPTVFVLIQWWAKHRFRTGADTSGALPLMGVGFQKTGDFLSVK